MNRVTIAIDKLQKSIDEQLANGKLTQEKVDQSQKNLDMSISEYVKFQEYKSLAFAMGVLDLNESNAIYGYLGESVETFNQQPLAVKYVLTKIFSELVQKLSK